MYHKLSILFGKLANKVINGTAAMRMGLNKARAAVNRFVDACFDKPTKLLASLGIALFLWLTDVERNLAKLHKDSHRKRIERLHDAKAKLDEQILKSLKELER